MIALIGSWLVATALSIFVSALIPPLVAKTAPFVLAGLITGRLVEMSGRARLIAALVLALVSAISWTAFTFATQAISGERALALFAASLPVHLLGGGWAWLAMFLVRRRVEARVDPELDELERDIKREMSEK